jgi:hypothetical protein
MGCDDKKIPEDGRGQPKIVTAKADEFQQTNDQVLFCQEDLCSIVLVTYLVNYLHKEWTLRFSMNIGFIVEIQLHCFLT